MHKHDTFYVLEDGAVVDPNEVAHDKDGVLRHKGGVAVSMKGDIPHTTGRPPSEPKKGRASKSEGKDVKPSDTKSGYTTRESKAD